MTQYYLYLTPDRRLRKTTSLNIAMKYHKMGCKFLGKVKGSYMTWKIVEE